MWHPLFWGCQIIQKIQEYVHTCVCWFITVLYIKNVEGISLLHRFLVFLTIRSNNLDNKFFVYQIQIYCTMSNLIKMSDVDEAWVRLFLGEWSERTTNTIWQELRTRVHFIQSQTQARNHTSQEPYKNPSLLCQTQSETIWHQWPIPPFLEESSLFILVVEWCHSQICNRQKSTMWYL